MSSNQIYVLFFICFFFFLIGLYVGWANYSKDAARWQWWRQNHQALCAHECATRVGLDLRKIYVSRPEQMDFVTDAAMRKN